MNREYLSKSKEFKIPRVGVKKKKEEDRLYVWVSLTDPTGFSEWSSPRPVIIPAPPPEKREPLYIHTFHERSKEDFINHKARKYSRDNRTIGQDDFRRNGQIYGTFQSRM